MPDSISFLNERGISILGALRLQRKVDATEIFLDHVLAQKRSRLVDTSIDPIILSSSPTQKVAEQGKTKKIASLPDLETIHLQTHIHIK